MPAELMPCASPATRCVQNVFATAARRRHSNKMTNFFLSLACGSLMRMRSHNIYKVNASTICRRVSSPHRTAHCVFTFQLSVMGARARAFSFILYVGIYAMGRLLLSKSQMCASFVNYLKMQFTYVCVFNNVVE